MMRRISSFPKTFAIAIVAVCLLAPPARILASTSNPAFKQTAATSALERPVQLRATASPHGVLIEWSDGLDPGTLGFNVYRITNGQRAKLNPGLIAGSALIAGARSQ